LSPKETPLEKARRVREELRRKRKEDEQRAKQEAEEAKAKAIREQEEAAYAKFDEVLKAAEKSKEDRDWSRVYSQQGVCIQLTAERRRLAKEYPDLV
jgi:hypothetical protein